MCRVLLRLALCLVLLSGCGSVVPQNGPDCRSAFAKSLPECQGQGTGIGTGPGLTQIPLATAGPTAIPVTPTPAAVRSEYYDGLMTRFGAYGIQMDGFSPLSSPPYHEVTNPFSAAADVVNLTIDGFTPIEGLQLLIVVLKMDDADYEQSDKYSCLKVEAEKLEQTQDGKVHDFFYPGSEDRYVYLCGMPGHYIRGYNGWAKFMTLDPSQRGDIIVRTCDSVNNCTEQTAAPVQPTQTGPAPTSAATQVP